MDKGENRPMAEREIGTKILMRFPASKTFAYVQKVLI
jgi:hypothetical protein